MAREMPQVPGVKHRFLNTAGQRTHVALAGEGDPVLLLHGWPEHWYAWRGVIPRLAERHHVIASDLRGFGWSDIAWTGFEKENMAEDAVRLLDALEIERVSVVGHDWGGWIGFLLALRHPERVQRLVAISSPAPWPQLTLRNLLALRHFAYQVPLATPIGKRALERRASYVRRMLRKSSVESGAFGKEVIKIYARDLKSPTRARASMLLYRTFLLRELGPVAAGRYRGERLTVPTLMLHGEGDKVVPQRLLTGAEHNADDLRVEIIPGAGHYLPEERPDVVADRTLEFLAGAREPVAQA